MQVNPVNDNNLPFGIWSALPMSLQQSNQKKLVKNSSYSVNRTEVN